MPTLMFIYNSDNGLFNTLTDIAHKIFSPRTYACNLCALTHRPIGMRREWKAFLAELGQPLEFLHRDEFRRRYGMTNAALPAIFRKTEDGQMDVRIDAATINDATSIEELQAAIRRELESDSA